MMTAKKIVATLITIPETARGIEDPYLEREP